MSHPWPPAGLMAKADRPCLSARTLLDAGDVDGACNRAYYAMFDAARAALLASDASLTSSIGKTHRGLINAFSERLIKHGPVSKDVGRLLKRAEEVRLIADYRGDSVELVDACELVEQAETFVSAMHRQLALEGATTMTHRCREPRLLTTDNLPTATHYSAKTPPTEHPNELA